MLRGMRRKTGINTVNAKNPYFCESNAPIKIGGWIFKMFIYSSLTVAIGT